MSIVGAKHLRHTWKHGLITLVRDSTARVHLLIVASAIFVFLFGFGVIGHVLNMPDIGVRSAFSTVVNQFDKDFLFPKDQEPLRRRDRIVAIGGEEVEDWPKQLRVLQALRDYDPGSASNDPQALRESATGRLLYQTEKLIRVDYHRGDTKAFVWLKVARPQVDTLIPTILWFFLKGGLFLVGALVFWQRPREPQARMFFLFCVVSCAAYVGGYNWHAIVTRPSLLLIFMATSVLLPSVSLHFYLIFPHPKPFYTRHPTATLLGMYGPALVFLSFLLIDFFHLRALAGTAFETGGSRTFIRPLLEKILLEIYVYFGIALMLYLLSIWCLVHGYRSASSALERNQVKWILFGAVAALAPMMYSLYLAVLERDRFGGGAATWPMFFASVCVTLSYTISITRYRLMELDKLVSSGAAYFSISVFAALLYYGMVIIGVLLLGSTIIAEPTVFQALGVSGTVLLLVVLLDLARSRIKKALDRHFRREKGQLDRTLQRMSEAVAQLVDPPTLAHRLLRTTTELLGVPRGAVYLRAGDPPLYRVSDSLGVPPPLSELSSGCPLVEELQQHGRLRQGPPGCESNGTAVSPALRQLLFLGGEVALALAHEGEMLALLVLGPRESDSYSDEDVNLLSAFAQVTVLALVSSEGGRTIEALNRDLQAKVDKIAEQQRRIVALQSQLLRKGPTASEKETEGNARRQELREETGATDVGVPGLPSVLPLAACPLLLAPGTIVGSSTSVQQLLHLVKKVAASSSEVLLRGESGTGKELLARAVHEHSPRATKPFVKVHCAALSAGLLESELFGHVRGAFTGAVRDRVGRFELANGGSLFLDEIGDVSWEVQTKLLRVLQEKTFERVGSSEPVQVDVRIIAATHQNLERLMQQGRFREDLFYRLDKLPIRVPPLRERREDIPELVQHFLDLHSRSSGKQILEVDDDALAVLKSAPWPGNIRQLENVLERAAIVAENFVITATDLPAYLFQAGTGEPVEEMFLGIEGERTDRERREREQLVRALAATAGNKAEAARALGMARSTLVSRLKKHGLS